MAGQDLNEEVLQVGFRIAKEASRNLPSLLRQLNNLIPDLNLSAVFGRTELPTPSGELSAGELHEFGSAEGNVIIPSEDVEAFRKELNVYEVDFAIKEDGRDDAVVLFKARDREHVYSALESVVRERVEALEGPSPLDPDRKPRLEEHLDRARERQAKDVSESAVKNRGSRTTEKLPELDR